MFIGNHLNETSLAGFKDYIADNKLESFGLNLYANSIGAGGAKHLAEGFTHLSVKDLDTDLYFNNITEAGTKDICDSILKIQNL